MRDDQINEFAQGKLKAEHGELVPNRLCKDEKSNKNKGKDPILMVHQFKNEENQSGDTKLMSPQDIQRERMKRMQEIMKANRSPSKQILPALPKCIFGNI